MVEWIGDCLVTELVVCGRGAQIINLDYDAVPERPRGRGRVWIGGWGYLEAASASATSSTAGTVCELVNGSRVPIQFLAARYWRTLSEFQGVA